jgi:hypothetical protein
MSSFVAFAAVTAVIIAVPGPSVLFTISRALTMGRRVALPNVAGNALGVYLQVVAVAFGIGAVVERSLLAFTVVKYVGAAYIVYLGVQAIRHRHSITEALGQHAVPVPTRRALRDGLVVGCRRDEPEDHRGLCRSDARVRCPGCRASATAAAGSRRAVSGDRAVPGQRLGERRGRDPRLAGPPPATPGRGRWYRRLIMIGVGVSLAFTGRKD